MSNHYDFDKCDSLVSNLAIACIHCCKAVWSQFLLKDVKCDHYDWYKSTLLVVLSNIASYSHLSFYRSNESHHNMHYARAKFHNTTHVLLDLVQICTILIRYHTHGRRQHLASTWGSRIIFLKSFWDVASRRKKWVAWSNNLWLM